MLFKRLYRSGNVTRCALGDRRCGVFDSARVALHDCLDQGRRLSEIFFWLAARFVAKLRDETQPFPALQRSVDASLSQLLPA